MTTRSDDPFDDEFVQEITRHQIDLLYFIRSLSGDWHAAMDIRQSVNMILWNKRDKFEPGTKFKSWAFKIAQFEVKKHFRARKKAGLVTLDDDILDLFAEEYEAHIDELPERRAALSHCIAKLTPKDLELIKHRYWSESSLESLAVATNRSVGTLKARLHQLRAALRACIQKELDAKA